MFLIIILQLLRDLHLDLKLQPHGKEPRRKEAEEEVDDDSSTSPSASRKAKEAQLFGVRARAGATAGALGGLGYHGNLHHCSHGDGGVITVHTPEYVRPLHTQ